MGKLLELYIHIPFCAKKCLYCDFLSAPADEDVQAAYMEALRKEIRGRAASCAGRTVISVFIGGGTPSLLPGSRIAGLMEDLNRYYNLISDAEITIEANPGTVDRGKLALYRLAGINRLSIGLQSADNRELASIGRIHTWKQFLQAYYDAVEAGFENINVDLMSALPGQTLQSCRTTLEKVLSLEPAPVHISAYSLILEEETPLYRMYEEGKISLPDEDTDRLLYHETGRILKEAGYHRYEISNYAKAGYECRHNCGYWNRTDYIGFGTGAASLFENRRFCNGADLQEYLARPMECRQQHQFLSVPEQMEEFMFLGLRRTEGISLRKFQKTFGRTVESVYAKVIEKNRADGLMDYRRSSSGESMLALTERGLDLSNYVSAQFLLT